LSDSPFKKPKRKGRKSSGKRGGRKGHQGTGPTLLSPTELVGGLTLRQALILQLTVLFKQAGPFEPIPASLASIVALGLGLHYGSHGDLLDQAFAL